MKASSQMAHNLGMLVLMALTTNACGQWQSAGDQPDVRNSMRGGSYDFVDVAGNLQGQRLSIRVTNRGSDVCIWSINLPSESGANGVAVGVRGLNERGEALGSRGPDIPVWSDKTQLGRGQTREFSMNLQETFGTAVGAEDCIFFDAFYFDCAAAENYADPLPAERRGLAQGTWIVRENSLEPAPGGVNGCRVRLDGVHR